jgi:hypothetical protein
MNARRLLTPAMGLPVYGMRNITDFIKINNIFFAQIMIDLSYL